VSPTLFPTLLYQMVRLIKYLASCGVDSRRNCESIIRSGRISINGERETNPFIILSESDSVDFDGKTIVPPNYKTTVVLNKPIGIITTSKDTHSRKTVLDIIPQIDCRLFPIGRLDKDTTGILLLTNDGDLAYSLTHPKFEIEKTYEVQVNRLLSDPEIQLIGSGIDIGNQEVGHAFVISQSVIKDKITILLRLYHGKKREVRRIFKSIGLKLQSLHRLTFAGIDLGNLSLGSTRELTIEEYNYLKNIDFSAFQNGEA